MTSTYAEDAENLEPSDNVGGEHGHDPAAEFEGELMPNPPETATEENDTVPETG